MFVIRTEDDGNQPAVRPAKIVGEVGHAIEPLHILRMCGGRFVENGLHHPRMAVVPRVPARQRVVQVAAGRDDFTPFVGLEDHPATDFVFTHVRLTVEPVVHQRAEIDAEYGRIVAANGLRIGASRLVVPVTAVPKVVVVAEHKASGGNGPQIRIKRLRFGRRGRIDHRQRDLLRIRVWIRIRVRVRIRVRIGAGTRIPVGSRLSVRVGNIYIAATARDGRQQKSGPPGKKEGHPQNASNTCSCHDNIRVRV